MGVKGRNIPNTEKVKKTRDTSKHRRLCDIGAKFLLNAVHHRFSSSYVVTEFSSYCIESPDVYGLRGNYSILIEVKISRSDFKADRKKPHRKDPTQGIGLTRYYLCPTGLIKENELPENWGLLYCDDKGNIEVIKVSEGFVDRNLQGEISILQSVVRRTNKRQVFDFRAKK